MLISLFLFYVLFEILFSITTSTFFQTLLDKDTIHNLLQYLTSCSVKNMLLGPGLKEAESFSDNEDALRHAFLSNLCKTFAF